MPSMEMRMTCLALACVWERRRQGLNRTAAAATKAGKTTFDLSTYVLPFGSAPVDVDGIRQCERVGAFAFEFRTQPVAFAVAEPGVDSVPAFGRGGESGLIGGRFAVDEDAERSAGGVV